MARRDENECAHCAETMGVETRYVGRDWKVYCAPACQQAGESSSAREEMRQRILITKDTSITQRKLNLNFRSP